MGTSFCSTSGMEKSYLNTTLSQKHPDVIVGVDLSGDARVNTLKDYYPSLIKAKEKGLKVALHFAEENNEAEIDFVLDCEVFKPDRVGHCTFVTSKFLTKFVELKIPSEICLSSNVKCGSVKCYESHHLKSFYEKNLPLCICTDDKGHFFSDDRSKKRKLNFKWTFLDFNRL